MRNLQRITNRKFREAIQYVRQDVRSGLWRVGAHDRIRINGYNVILSYRGNPVASYNVRSNILKLDTCGWSTPTTRRRFEVLCSLFALPPPRIFRGSLHIGDLSGSRFVFDFGRLENVRSAPLSSPPSSPPPLKLNDKFFLPPETDLFT